MDMNQEPYRDNTKLKVGCISNLLLEKEYIRSRGLSF